MRRLTVPLERYSMSVRRARDAHNTEQLSIYSGELRAATRARWAEIEDALKPPMRKYGG
jgi:hypothetical protein